MFSIYGPVDPVIKCPYNTHHRIARSRIQRHLVKCEKNYPEDYKVICPYNATHRLSKSEIQNHIVKCPMSRLVEPDLYERNPKHGGSDYKQLEITSTVECDENWDNETESDFTATVESDNEKTEPDNVQLNLDKLNSGEMHLRPPRGFAESMMLEQSEDSMMQDVESVTSIMAVGRGRINIRNIKKYQAIGRGRGRPLDQDL